MSNDGTTLESWIEFAYGKLLNLRNEGIDIKRRSKICEISGVEHEIDVFYQFSKAGIKHRVAIECKDWNRPISKGRVMEFHDKLMDIGNIAGVMVSKKGYQSGASDYARRKSIATQTPEDLPDLLELTLIHVTSRTIPAVDAMGQPFWTIIHSEQGNLFATYDVFLDDNFPEFKLIPLFVSKKHAEKTLKLRSNAKMLEVRGFEQHVLLTLVEMIKTLKSKMLFAYLYDLYGNGPQLRMIVKTPEEIKQHFIWAG